MIDRWRRRGARSRLARRALLSMLASLAVLGWLVSPGLAVPGGGNGSANTNRQLHSEAKSSALDDDITRAETEYWGVATAPAATVSSDAFVSAFAEAASLPVIGGSWSEVTTQEYQNDDPRYRDPVWSNSGAGWGLVTGRATALAVDPGDPSRVYAGFADGGVWRSLDGGTTWTNVFDDFDSIAIGALAINPDDGSVWVGTGENNTAFENFKGVGVFRSTDDGASWDQVGGDEVADSTVGELKFDGVGNVYAATSRGLWRHSSSDIGGSWDKMFDAATFGFAAIPYGLSLVNDVEIRPGTDGRVIVANMAWRNGTAYDGFYESTDGGDTWAELPLKGAITAKSLGRSSLAYSADGSKLYAVVESTFLINHPNVQSGNTVLDGVFVSRNGDPNGPWSLIADYRKLQNSGSALRLSKGYAPGVQAWYNQFVGVDPNDANHVYVGLEEVFETRDGGRSWHAIGPYWNFGLPCFSLANPENCPDTTHPDQHAVAFGGGNLFVGNDGGVWSRSLGQSSSSVAGWNNLNATLHTLQYYSAGVGDVEDGNGHGAGQAVWGGMQDNGVSLIAPGLSTMVSPFGGDGFTTMVDPDNGDRAVVEYANLDMALTTNGGYAPNYESTAWREITPSCFAFTYTPSPCDPNPRFNAPFTSDVGDFDHWVAGGEFVWDNGGKGFDTSCSSTSCDWTIVDDTGSGHSVTAIAVEGDTIYAGWCGPAGCNPSTSSTTGAGFQRGIDVIDLSTDPPTVTHLDLSSGSTGLPNRFISGLAVDPSDPQHVYAALGGFSRRWIDSAGVGHVFETTDGGGTWTDISGNLPDAPARDVLLTGTGKIALATDVGVFVSDQSDPTDWSQLGTLPHAAIDDLSLYPGGTDILAATHGRGLWKIATP